MASYLILALGHLVALPTAPHHDGGGVVLPREDEGIGELFKDDSVLRGRAFIGGVLLGFSMAQIMLTSMVVNLVFKATNLAGISVLVLDDMMSFCVYLHTVFALVLSLTFRAGPQLDLRSK